MKEQISYYSRKDIQKAMLFNLKNREAIAKYQENFGQRPDIIQYENDILELVKKGATSFHISEEHWSNPLLLKPGMSKIRLDQIRIGWDLLIDIDSENLDYSKITSFLIIEALKFHNIENIGVKYSGNRGFHIFIPFKAFPTKINNRETKFLFPEGPKAIASYLKSMIEPHLKEKLNTQDPFKLTEIDTILISNRHLFRAPFSFNEKSGLVSIPIEKTNILNFKKEQALPENVKTNIKFLDIEAKDQEASQLIMQAFDFELKQKKETKVIKEYQAIETAIPVDYFPPCIKNAFQGMKDDGRKRTVFILINFLRQLGWSFNNIEALLLDLNKKNEKPLPEAYVKAQINWSKNQELRLPPNCDNPNYYIHPDIGICQPDHLCKKIKNPVNYAKLKQSLFAPKTKKKAARNLYKSK